MSSGRLSLVQNAETRQLLPEQSIIDPCANVVAG
jgi:hypothetical protein